MYKVLLFVQSYAGTQEPETKPWSLKELQLTAATDSHVESVNHPEYSEVVS